MRKQSGQRIRIGIGGWTYPPWRGVFYPDDLPQRRELEFASRRLSTIEINGTYYGSQKPESFAKWHDETPDDFVFSVKGPRFTTNRRVLAEAGQSVERFFNSGVLQLQDKLGPINWQFMPTKKFDSGDFENFLKLLPADIGGRPIRHAVEVRHDSFNNPEFIALARHYNVAIVIAADAEFPCIAEITGSFVYARLMGTREGEPNGYDARAIKKWAAQAKQWAEQPQPGKAPAKTARDVFVYVISGYKASNPAAAIAIAGG